ncbi:ImmA/IrrE family metallo-endopeptidase [Hyphomonas sp. NPDC076900]|uniref:ImmA/IrrE family metallo-endopeptidase n=1 Tax=unclassified Hyphomonas TaxID=2630699 RepID=UPI003D0221A7
MSAGTEALVDPLILGWLRKSAGFTVDQVAHRLKKDKEFIFASERGEVSLTIGQVRDLADLYKRALSDFFLPTPPKESALPHDFRRLPGEVAGTYSPKLIRELKTARDRRDVALDLFNSMDQTVPSLTAKLNSGADPESAGELIRRVLKVSISDQLTWGDGAGAYKAWRALIRNAGVLVFQFDTVPEDEVLGFSLSDRPLPVVGVSVKQTENRRTFTILHEFVHVLMQESSVCDIDDFQPRNPTEMAVEVFCNASAAAALMPKSDFLNHSVVRNHRQRSNWSDTEISEAARDFGVSRFALVRRLLTLNLTTRDFYAQKQAQYTAEYKSLKAAQREKNADKEFRRSYSDRAVHNLDHSFIRSVLQGYHSRQLTLLDASNLLDVRPERVKEVEVKLTRAAG